MKGEREMREHEVAYCLIFATLCFFCGKPRIGIKLLTAGLLFHCPFPRTRVQLHSRGRKSPVGRHFLNQSWWQAQKEKHYSSLLQAHILLS